LFFSTFSTPILSAVLTFLVYIAGFFSADLRNFDQVVDSRLVQGLARGLYYVLPNLGSFDVTAQVIHGLPISWRYMAVTTAYGFSYIAILLVMSVTIFSRRDFK
jgi:Cu-processing system permease protein